MGSFSREILIPKAGGAFILFPIWNTSPYLQVDQTSPLLALLKFNNAFQEPTLPRGT